MIKRLSLWLILTICVAWTTHATIDVHSTFITTSNGLANNTIRYIFQDSKGFIWISTVNGLSRYDGHSFINFRPEKGSELSINYHHVHQIEEDKNGFLWIGSAYYKYSCYDLKHDCFVDYTGSGEYHKEYRNRTETSDGNCWLWGSQNGCRLISYKDRSFSSNTFTKNNGKLPSNQVNHLIEDEYGNSWICTQSGLVKFTNGKTEIIDWTKNLLVAALNKNKECFFLSKEGTIYTYETNKGEISPVVSLNQGMGSFHLNSQFQVGDEWIIFSREKCYAFNLSTRKVIEPPLQIPNGRFVRDNKGNVYIFNGTGKLHFLDSESRKIKTFQLTSQEKISPASGEQYKVMIDKRGLIWITVFGNGLFIYNPHLDEMTHYTYQEEGRNRVCSNFLNQIIVDRSDNIWIGSEYSGLTRLSVLNDGATRIFPEDPNLTDHSNAVRMLTRLPNGEIWAGTRKGDIYAYDNELTPKVPHTVPYTHIYAVAEDSIGKLWLGSRGNGVCIDEKWFKHNDNDPQSLAFDHIFHILRDHKNRMWIGTFGGGLDLAIPENNGYMFRHFLTESTGQKEIRINVQDDKNRMWVGTDSGVCIFHPDSIIANPDNYSSYSFDNNKFPGNEIKCVYRDSKNRMWVGVLGRGFCLCTLDENKNELHFKQYTTANGLVNNMVELIIEDQAGKLWIATEYGISRFNPEAETFENFFFSASMQGNVHNSNSALLLENGNLLFGTNHGLSIIDPTRVTSNSTLSDITFTDLKVNGISVHPNDKDSPLTEALTYTNHIKLKHNQNSFVIEFSTLDYSITNETRYTYRLENFDKDWSIPSSLNFAAYKNLEPGTYRLHVKACNTAGIWSNQEAIMHIIITPPFWKTTWAYLIYILLIGIVLYTAFHLIRNFNTLRNRILVEKQLTEYKLMFFTNISHEFRTPLTLIKGALEKIEVQNQSSKEMAYPIQLMNKSTDRMLRLVNQLLEFRKMQNNKLTLKLEEADVITFLREISHHFEDLATDKEIDFRFSSSMVSYPMFIDKGKLDKITYNLLSNAFKYTPNKGNVHFSVSVNEEGKQLTLSVSDTGIGIPKGKQKELFSRFMQSSFSNESVGIGLHLTHELVNVLKGQISFNENKGGGSIFTVSLPLESAVYGEKDFLIPSSLLTNEPSHPEKNEEEATTDNNTYTSHQVPINKKKVLVIEDDNDVRHFLQTELGNYFEVVSEADGVSGFERAKTYDADLIICDVLMPGMNGFEVTRKLKTNFETSHIPIILLTAMSAPENQLKGVESGADAYITKPFSLKLLLAHTFQLIEQREKLRNKFSNDPTMMNPILCSTTMDKKFADRLHAIMEKQLANADFTIEDFASTLNLGRTVFFRKVKGVTGYTPNEYMRIIRMKKAVELLQEGTHNISEVTYMVGMNDPLYFSKCFKAQFGVSPSVYTRGNKGKEETD